MLTATVEAVPIGYVIRTRNETGYEELVRDGGAGRPAAEAPVLAFPARTRALHYAAVLELYWRAIDRRELEAAGHIGAKLEHIRTTYGDAWQNAGRTRRRTCP